MRRREPSISKHKLKFLLKNHSQITLLLTK
jgi:hypothetical protein